MLFCCSNKVDRESAACTYPQSYDVSVHVYTYAIEDDERIAAKEERARIATTEEAENIRQHEKDVLRIQAESDRIRSQETSMSHVMNDSAYRHRNSGRSPKLPVFCDGKDDMDAYLQRFERYAENEG